MKKATYKKIDAAFEQMWKNFAHGDVKLADNWKKILEETGWTNEEFEDACDKANEKNAIENDKTDKDCKENAA